MNDIIDLSVRRAAIVKFETYFRVEPSGCWIWFGPIKDQKHPYGRLKIDRFNWKAHRLAWVLFRGPIPEGVNVLHRCDIPQCVNPAHLFLGTQRDNVQDMMAKHRDNRNRGEAILNSILTEAQVREIKAELKRSGGAYGECRRLGRLYGVSGWAISRIKTGQNWRHVAA